MINKMELDNANIYFIYIQKYINIYIQKYKYIYIYINIYIYEYKYIKTKPQCG